MPVVSPLRCAAWLGVVVPLAACQADELEGSGRRGRPPSAVLVATPSTGIAPLVVTLGAEASADPEGKPLLARWDADGDGVFEAELGDALSLSATYPVAGEYAPAVEVVDADGLSARASVTVLVLPDDGEIDLLVDTDRNGTLTLEDQLGEEAWSQQRGAIFLANLDDDDDDEERDGGDDRVNGELDALDLAPAFLRQAPDLAAGGSLEVTVEPEAAAERVRLFALRDGGWEVVVEPGEGPGQLSPADIRDADLVLGVEAITGRSGAWDGRVSLGVTLFEGSQVRAQDAVALRVSATILPDNIQPPVKLYVMRLNGFSGSNLAFYQTLADELPAGVSLYTVSEYDYWSDRWVQDGMQTGYQEMPGANGPRRVANYVQLQRPTGDYGLEYLLPHELVDRDFGFTYQGGEETSHNYGGNLEVAPPHTVGETSYPFGRVIIGGGGRGLLDGSSHTDRMNGSQRAWLAAQEVQGEPVEVSSEWLAVGHVDEIFQFVPDPSAPADRPWKLVLASPALARQALQDLQAAGGGGAPIFEDRDEETSVDEILEDDDLMAFNQAAQTRIDSVRSALAEAIGLRDEDVVEVPVLYEPVWYGNDEMAVAYNPGVQNLVTLGTTLFVPDPEGPEDDSGQDVWQAQIDAALEPRGLTVHFVDVFESYHVLMGEAHCGTNVEQAPYTASWWGL